MDRTRSAFADYPGYRVDLLPGPARVRVWQGETLLADTRRALRVEETAHKPVLYLPEEDLRRELFAKSDHHSWCPFKGEASYLSLVDGERRDENLVWTYRTPFEEVAGIRGYVAFYAGRVRVEAEEGAAGWA